LAALAEGENRIENFLVSGVTQAMLKALTELDVAWKLDGTTLTVQGCGLNRLRSPKEALDCGNSATTIRLLAGALAAAGLPAVLDGSPGLRRRPMERIVEPLQAMGVPIEPSDRGTAPLKLTSRPPAQPLHPIDYTLPVASAQVKSCLLLAALAADGPTVLREPGPSRDHTERMLRSMRVSVTSEQLSMDNSKAENPGNTLYITRIVPPREGALRPLRLTLPGDISSAAFLIVAALVTPGSEITLRDVGLNPSRTGLLDALGAMGADLQIVAQNERHGEPVGDLRVRHSRLNATRVNGPLVVRMIDEFPAFAVAAAYARGTTLVSEADELHHKESDRISALCQELCSLGVQASETPDGFIIQGGQALQGGTVQPHGDHRLAMSLAVAGLAAQAPVTVEGAEIIAESFPEFVTILQNFGADLRHGS
jgi:3-phosphoshikimate 1-carboxyvinyltransferase